MKTYVYPAELVAVCSAAEAAELLKLTPQRVQQFCGRGRLAARKIGREWIISRQSLLAFAAIDRLPGNRATQSKVSSPPAVKKKSRPRR